MTLDILHKKKWKNYFLGFCFALFLNFEGIIANVFGITIESGFFNQFYAPLFFVIFGVSFLLYYKKRVENEEAGVSPLFISTLFLSVLMILFSLKWMDDVKLFRDLIYLWLIYLAYQLFHWGTLKKNIRSRDFINGFVFSFIVLFPLLNIFYSFGIDIERFSGWVLSKPQFANMVLITGLIFFNQSGSNKRKHIVGILCLSLIFASGTRTTLLIFILYYAYHFFLLHSENVGKRLLIVSTVSILLGVGIFIFIQPYLDSIAAFSANFRALSFEDIEDGSIFSRLSWYSAIFGSLLERNLLGGFGAGASENLLGLLPHFDFLRFWYDYSIIFAVGFMVNLIYMYIEHNKFKTFTHKIMDSTVFVIIIFTLMGHNVFQSFDMVLMIMVYIMSIGKDLMYEFSRSFYRISTITNSGNSQVLSTR